MCGRDSRDRLGMGVWLPYEGRGETLAGYGESDWAGEEVSEESVSCGVLVLGVVSRPRREAARRRSGT